MTLALYLLPEGAIMAPSGRGLRWDIAITPAWKVQRLRSGTWKAQRVGSRVVFTGATLDELATRIEQADTGGLPRGRTVIPVQ